MRKLARYLKYHKKEVIIGPFFKLLEAIFELIVPLVMASIIDIGIKEGNKAFIMQRGGILILLAFMGLIFAFICQYSAAKASQGVGTKLRNDLYSHVNSLSHEEIDKLGTNYITTIITNDVNQIQLSVAMLIRLVVRAPFLVIGATVMAMMLDLKLSLVFIIVGPLVALVMYIIMKKSVPYYNIRQKTLDKISLITKENLTGARVIRAFSTQKKEKKRFEKTNDEVADIAIRVGQISAFLNPVNFIILNFAIVAIIWFGGGRVNVGSLTQGEVIAFVNYITQISVALVVVANLVVIFTKAIASAERINGIFDMEASISDKELPDNLDKAYKNQFDPSKAEYKLSLQNVSFTYPGAEGNAIEGLNIDIKPGQTIGIIGGTGSGKSTLINLLPRFYDVTQGEIRKDGKLISEYPLKELRQSFGFVPQRAVLFYGSIIDNMRWRKEDASIDEIKEAIEIAQAKDFVEDLSNGYSSTVAQGGKNFSGGQRQRLTIARALVGKPEILVLDDSFSALDYATDAKLRNALREKCKGMTTIIVSQRAHTIKNADQIIVLDNGKVAGIGSHNQLLETCRVYQEIYSSQVSDDEEGQDA